IKDTGAGCVPTGTADPEGGAVLPPSITFYSGDASGDARPVRTIQGDKTQLDFPMGLSVDEDHDEFAVANNGSNSILVFSRTSRGCRSGTRLQCASLYALLQRGRVRCPVSRTMRIMI